SPGRLQAYWRLTEPVDTPTAEHYNRRLAQHLGADATGWDATQLLRIPNTVNHKYPEKPLVTVLAQTGRHYDLTTIASSLVNLPLFGAGPAHTSPPRPEVGDPARATPPMPGIDLDSLPLTTTARRTLQGEQPKKRPDGEIDRSASLLAMARVLYGAGVPAEEIPSMLAERDEQLGWGKYTERVRRIIRRSIPSAGRRGSEEQTPGSPD
ncbi:MAG TPA: DNA-primase RepB domain-containing protein, partial [Herpetosiphonaceae bacterium]|nr:DNA-primase RepB domain-containing protein [Herpetosiphonaceae bacterium]